VPQFDEPLLDGEEELPQELRLGLERLRGKRPSPERVAAMAAAIGAATVAGSASAATPVQGAETTAAGNGAVSVLPFASPVAKLALVVGGVAGAGALAFFLARPSAEPDTAGTPARTPSFVSTAHPAGSSPALSERSPAGSPRAGVPRGAGSETLGSSAVEPSVAAEANAEAPPPDSLAGPETQPAPAPAPSTPSRSAELEARPSGKATPQPAAEGARVPAPGTSTPTSRLPTAPAGKATEAELLRDARQVLDRNPLVALSLCDEHQRDYPRGGLTQERELIAITALLRLGRTASAESRAARFRSAYPSSPYLGRLDRLVPP
jgi:hypothetical protein